MLIKIEIPKGSHVKYEFDKARNQMCVDRIVDQAYPFNYGFIPGTLWADGDPLDAIVLGSFSLYPGVELRLEPIALIKMYDSGVSDFKLVFALPSGTLGREIKTVVEFLRTYKAGTYVAGVSEDPAEIKECVDLAFANVEPLGGAKP